MTEHSVPINNFSRSRNLIELIKKFIVFCFFIFSFPCSLSLAQNFFPSEIGNKYQIHQLYVYEDELYSYVDYEWQASSLSNDTIINGNRFVKFSGALLGSAYYYFDESAGLLFIKNNDYDSVRLAIDFNTAPGDSFISYINGNARYYVAEAPVVINFFGYQVLTKTFKNNYTTSYGHGNGFYTFAENIGCITKYSQHEQQGPYVYTWTHKKIRSAIIDTAEYGEITLQINSISPIADRPENLFPFIVNGNYTSNLNIWGYTVPDDDLVDSFYIDIIQVRGSDTLGTFRYHFDTSYHATVTLLPQAGDKLLLRAFVSDRTIFNNLDVYPDTGYAVITVLPPEAGPNFFPMKEGNTYQYLYTWGIPIPGWPIDSTFIRLDIIKGDMINGEQFYRFITTGYEHVVTFNPNEQFRFDSLHQKLWIKLPGDPQIKLAADYTVPQQSTYTSYITGSPLNYTSEGTSPVIIGGEEHYVHSIKHLIIDVSYWWFAFTSDIGLSGWENEHLWVGIGTYSLIAAVLDSVIFSGPFSIDSITPSGSRKIDQFPVQTTTFYTMDHAAFVDSFYLFIEHYRNGALLESFVKNIPHSGAADSGVVSINLPDRQVGDIIKLKAEASDTCMLHHQAVYPDTGWVLITITDSITSLEPMDEVIDYSLAQNYPNPFNPSTTISYSIPAQGKVRLIIYDALGREVKTLVDEEKTAGNYEVKFKADGLSSGMYFYRLSAGERVISKKMILLK